MFDNVCVDLGNKIYNEFGDRYLDKFDELSNLINDEYQDFIKTHSDINLSNLDEDETLEFIDDVYTQYTHACS